MPKISQLPDFTTPDNQGGAIIPATKADLTETIKLSAYQVGDLAHNWGLSGDWKNVYNQVNGLSATWGGGSSKWTEPGGSITYITQQSFDVGIGTTAPKDKLHVDKNLTCVFTDSWSQTGHNVEDPLQQEHWVKETGILWDFTTSREDTFGFMTIDDILEENARLKEENKWLNDIITNNITQLTEMIQNNAEKINTNEGNIRHNTETIQDNADNLGIVDLKVNSNSGQIVS